MNTFRRYHQHPNKTISDAIIRKAHPSFRFGVTVVPVADCSSVPDSAKPSRQILPESPPTDKTAAATQTSLAFLPLAAATSVIPSRQNYRILKCDLHNGLHTATSRAFCSVTCWRGKCCAYSAGPRLGVWFCCFVGVSQGHFVVLWRSH